MRCIRALTLSVVLPISLWSSVAVASPPQLTPKEVARLTFESGAGESYALAPATVIDGRTTVAYWGPTGLIARSGSRSLWCAGSAVSGSAPLWGTPYPAMTRGSVSFKIPALEDYYESRLSFFYNYPSRGGADDYAFGVGWRAIDTAGDAVGTSDLRDDFSLTGPTAWVSSGEIDLTSPINRVRLSRVRGEILFSFLDRPETWQTPTSGLGASVDDVVVTGFRYGPVRSVAATYTTSAGVRLTWSAPYRSRTTSTVEDRPHAYRVWRSPAGFSTWEELTTDRIATPSFVDATAVRGRAYDYVVQAWDPGTGSHYGVVTKPFRFLVHTPADATGSNPVAVTLASKSTTLSTYGASYRVTGRLTVGGIALPGAVVTLQSSHTTTGFADTRLMATTDAKGAFSLTVTPSSRSHYRVRFGGDEALREATSAFVQVVPRAKVTAPSVPATMYASRSAAASGYLYPAHAPSAPVRVHRYRWDGSKWRSYGYVTAKTAAVAGDASRSSYRASLRLSPKGRWRVRSYHADSGHAPSWSGYKYVTVK